MATPRHREGPLLNEDELTRFLTDSSADKRPKAIDALLRDPRVADSWMGFWQDLLAENPTLINQSIGSTEPFRWYLMDAVRDNKSVDRIATQITLMHGHSIIYTPSVQRLVKKTPTRHQPSKRIFNAGWGMSLWQAVRIGENSQALS